MLLLAPVTPGGVGVDCCSKGRLVLIKILRQRKVDYSGCKNEKERTLAVNTAKVVVHTYASTAQLQQLTHIDLFSSFFSQFKKGVFQIKLLCGGYIVFIDIIKFIHFV